MRQMSANDKFRKLEEGSGTEMLAEVGRLILLLIGKIIYRFIKLIIKGVKFAISSIKSGIRRLIIFWNSTSTQAKLRLFRRSLKIGLRKFGHWCYLALKFTVRFIIWCIKGTIKAIFHLKSTLIIIGKGLKKGLRAFFRCIRRCGRGIRLGHIKRVRAYKRFRKNKGFKGLLIDIANYLKDKLNSYMDEEQDEAHPDAITEDDLMEEEIEEMGENSKTHVIGNVIGKKLISSVKDILDSDEEDKENGL